MGRARVAVAASLATRLGVLAWSAGPALAAPQWLLPPTVMVGPNSVGEACTITPCPPWPLFYTGGYEPEFHVSVGATGDALALMVSTSGELLAETRPAGGTFGPPQTLDPSYFVGSQVPEFQAAFDAQGN